MERLKCKLINKQDRITVFDVVGRIALKQEFEI